jgi:hypothetical protein
VGLRLCSFASSSCLFYLRGCGTAMRILGFCLSPFVLTVIVGSWIASAQRRSSCQSITSKTIAIVTSLLTRMRTDGVQQSGKIGTKRGQIIMSDRNPQTGREHEVGTLTGPFLTLDLHREIEQLRSKGRRQSEWNFGLAMEDSFRVGLPSVPCIRFDLEPTRNR